MWEREELIRRAYGEVYAALYKNNRAVAVKKIKLNTESNEVPKECENLRKCNDDFIVRYYDYLIVDDELWVLINPATHH